MKSVVVRSPSRLHFGLLNEEGLFGWIDGGVGVSIFSPSWLIEVCRGNGNVSAEHLEQEHRVAIESALQTLEGFLGGQRFLVRVRRAVPLHIGLGSKTSLLMGVAAGACLLAGRHVPPRELARVLGRGGTSGIGVTAFTTGGFVCDVGHRYPDAKSQFGPSSEALAEPAAALFARKVDWFKVVHFRWHEQGFHGAQEVAAFQANCPLPRAETLKTLKYALGFVIPAMWRKDLHMLQDGIRGMQACGFKKVEWRYQDRTTREFCKYWRNLRMPEALGLSGFGPTLYVLTRRPAVIRKAVYAFGAEPCHFSVTTAASTGATIRDGED